MGLRKALVNNLPDLPADLNWNLLMKSKVALKDGLNKKYGNNKTEKIKAVHRLLEKFQDGTIRSDLNHRENLVAATMVLLELNGKEM